MALDLLSHSIFNDSILIEKFQTELSKINDLNIDDVKKNIKNYCNTCRTQGFKMLSIHNQENENRFLSDFVYLVSQSNSIEEIINCIYLIKPRLYHYEFIGMDYVIAVIYFEALIQIISGETLDLVLFRMNSILNGTEKIILCNQ